MLARLLLTSLAVQLRFSSGQTCSKMSAASTESQNEAKLHSVAFVTAPNDTVAKEIARGLVKNKLAACVNIIPGLTSVYEWEGEVNEDSEVLLMIKTRTARIADLTDFVVKHHPYKVCEVVSAKIDDGNLPYLKWISDSVPDRRK